VPGDSMQQASAVSRLAMNGAQMAGAVLAGFCVAAIGPGWALTFCGTGLLGTLPLMLSLRVTSHERGPDASMLRDLREGWSEFRSHTWIWVVTAQFAVVMMAWYGSVTVLGPAVMLLHFGPHEGAAAWGAITGADSLGLIAGGLMSLRFTPRRPMLFIVAIGAGVAIAPLALAMFWPLPLICVAAFGLGITIEIMMVQWTVAMARNIPPEKLARVSSYDALGTVMAMPLGAVVAGPIAASIGVARTQAGAAVLIVAASLLALIPRDIRKLRASQLTGPLAADRPPALLLPDDAVTRQHA
jgi:predicted MFS family arabinose efflux permease